MPNNLPPIDTLSPAYLRQEWAERLGFTTEQHPQVMDYGAIVYPDAWEHASLPVDNCWHFDAWDYAPEPTTDIAAAVWGLEQVRERLKARAEHQSSTANYGIGTDGDKYLVEIFAPYRTRGLPRGAVFASKAPTLPLAITRATVAALRGLDDTGKDDL